MLMKTAEIKFGGRGKKPLAAGQGKVKRTWDRSNERIQIGRAHV